MIENFNNNQIIEQILDGINLHDDFLKLTKSDILKKFESYNIFDFIPQKLSDTEIVLALYIKLAIAVEKYWNKEQYHCMFEDIARHLELTIRYSSSFKNKLSRQKELYLISAICYNISDKNANSIVLIKNVKEILDTESKPLDTIENLSFIFNESIVNFLARDIISLQNNLKDINDLKAIINEFINEEPNYSKSILGYYQVFKSFEILIDCWKNGFNDRESTIKEFINKAKNNFLLDQNAELYFIVELIEICINSENKKSIHILPNDNELWQKYKEHLINRNIIDFWPSQVEAIEKNILSDHDFIISAPTSSGKSFIAELRIIYNLVHFPDLKIVYIVPSRALASQVYSDLSKNLDVLEIKVGILVGGVSFPEYDNIILNISNIIVFTMEKFEIIINTDNSVKDKFSLIIIDESHNIGTNERGLKLEILITNLIDQERKYKILMLSAVTPNPDDLSKWLSKDDLMLKSDWNPTRRIHSLLKMNGTLQFYDDLKGISPKIAIKNDDNTSKKAIFLAKLFSRNYGLSMIFATSKQNAEKYAQILFNEAQQNIFLNKDASERIKLILGENSKLAKFIEKGIAYHHAGLPPSAKKIVEFLIRENKIKIVCATTTLAEGLNTPVSSIIFPSLWMRYEYMSKMIFRNLIGRAGRALQHTEGNIILIETENFGVEKAEDFINLHQNSIEEVQSFLEKMNDSLYLLTSTIPKDEYLESKTKIIKRNLLELNREILSALIQKSFDGLSINKFLLKTFFGFRKNNNKVDKRTYDSIYHLIQDGLDQLERLEIPIIQKFSPYHATKFGYLSNNVGLLPSTMTKFALELSKLLNDDDQFNNFLILDVFDDEFIESLLKLLNLFSKADEIIYSDDSDLFLDKNSSRIILSWIKGASYYSIAEKYFIDEENSITNSVVFCEQFIKNYANWFMYGINSILTSYFEIEIGLFCQELPFYLTYGTFNKLNAMFQALEISSRSVVLEKLASNIVKMNPRLNTMDVNLLKEYKKSAQFSEFIYPNITELELTELKDIWSNFQINKLII